jgi:hypothetical protein
VGGVETYKEDSKINDEARQRGISSNKQVSFRWQGLSQRGSKWQHRFEKAGTRSPQVLPD